MSTLVNKHISKSGQRERGSSIVRGDPVPGPDKRVVTCEVGVGS